MSIPGPQGNANAQSILGWINVKSYGAVGNGTTDDTVAVQAAVNAAPVGGAVYFPTGTYIVSSPIKLQAGVTYFGAGWGSVIQQASGAQHIAEKSANSPVK